MSGIRADRALVHTRSDTVGQCPVLDRFEHPADGPRCHDGGDVGVEPLDRLDHRLLTRVGQVRMDLRLGLGATGRETERVDRPVQVLRPGRPAAAEATRG